MEKREINILGKSAYLLLTLLVMLVGLASRRYASPNGFIYNYLGDVLWATMIYFGCRFLLIRLPLLKSALVSVCFCFFIELSQLYQAEWINALRHTTLGGLILGFGFLWSDLVSYSIGVIFGYVVDVFFHKFLKFRI